MLTEITKEIYTRKLQTYTETTRQDLEMAMANLSHDHSTAYPQIKGQGGLIDMMNAYCTNIEQQSIVQLRDEQGLHFLEDVEHLLLYKVPEDIYLQMITEGNIGECLDAPEELQSQVTDDLDHDVI